jgi:nucleotide-binding universal stress UspA family protein
MAAHKNILVGVDGSDASLHAFTEAVKLADRGVKLVAVSVAPEYNGDLRLVGVHDAQKLIRQPCDAALSRCQRAADDLGVQVKTICALGQPYERLVELADDENSDLIIIGAKGLTSLKFTLLGSVARKVIGFTPRDVLVVPEGARISWQKILLATDLSPHSQGAENRAIELALANKSKLSILKVMELPTCLYGEAGELGCSLPESRSQLLEALVARAADWGITPEIIVKQGESYKAIVETAQQCGAGVIVMGSHGRTGLTRLLMGSNTEKVIGHAACPVLVVKVS